MFPTIDTLWLFRLKEIKGRKCSQHSQIAHCGASTQLGSLAATGKDSTYILASLICLTHLPNLSKMGHHLPNQTGTNTISHRKGQLQLSVWLNDAFAKRYLLHLESTFPHWSAPLEALVLRSLGRKQSSKILWSRTGFPGN